MRYPLISLSLVGKNLDGGSHQMHHIQYFRCFLLFLIKMGRIDNTVNNPIRSFLLMIMLCVVEEFAPNKTSGKVFSAEYTIYYEL